MRWWQKVVGYFSKSNADVEEIAPDVPLSEYYSPADVFWVFNQFPNADDLVYFPHFNAYCAFKYPVVRDILANNTDIGVSDVHLELNGIYFSLNEDFHQHNKRAAIRHLDFLSKALLNEDSTYARELFHYFSGKIVPACSVDLRAQLINPIVFINALNDFGFAEMMPQFNIFHPEFDHPLALSLINDIFSDTTQLDRLFEHYFEQGGSLPEEMQAFVQDIHSDHKMENKDWAGFFRSMMFSATESTSSFICSLIRVLVMQFPQLLQQPGNHEDLKTIANEVLRIHTPVPYIYRTVRKATVYSGIPLKEGDTVIVFIGTANLDPQIFEDPMSIKFDRKEKHLSFGKGPYACIGQTASMRLALNLVRYLSESYFKIEVNDTNEEAIIFNGMIRVPMNFTMKMKYDSHG